MNLNQYLETAVANYTNKDAIRYKGKKFSYKELFARTCKLANSMKKLGIKKGDVVGILSTNNNNYFEIMFACSRIGAVSAHYNWRLHPKSILELINDSDTKMLFVSSTNKGVMDYLEGKCSRLESIVLIEGNEDDLDCGILVYEKLIKNENEVCELEKSRDDDVILYLYTSGTTSKPKTVMHTNKSIVTHALVFSIEHCNRPEEVFLHAMPMFHSSTSVPISFLLMGATVVLMDSYDPEVFLMSIQEEKVNRFALVPVMLDWLVGCSTIKNYDISSLESISYAGSTVAIETLRRVNEAFGCKMYQVYGTTEMAPCVTMLKPEQHLEFLDKDRIDRFPAGKALLGTSIRIVKDDGSECKTLEAGEIIVKSDTMMKGYKDSSISSKAIRNGWYYTGDIGYLDDNNYLFIMDRKHNMIISGGENIYPAEIEDCIRSMGEDISDVAVIGVADEIWGESIKAIIVRSKGSKISEEEVMEYCRSNIDSYKKPRSVEFWDEVPRNNSGKIEKKKIKEILKMNQCNI